MKVGQTVYLQTIREYNESDETRYRSRIAEITEKDVWLEMPFDEEQRILKTFLENDELTGFYVSPDGVRNYFETKVLGYSKKEVRLMIVQKPLMHDVRRFQRRNFLRLVIELEMAISFQRERQVVVTYDIGGGGVCFLAQTPDMIEMGEMLTCWLALKNKNGTVEFIHFSGIVIRFRTFLRSSAQGVVLQFTSISPEDQQKIVRYVIEAQLAKRKT